MLILKIQGSPMESSAPVHINVIERIVFLFPLKKVLLVKAKFTASPGKLEVYIIVAGKCYGL